MSDERRPVDSIESVVIPDHFVPKLEMQGSENRLGLGNQNLGDVAILANCGVILEEGGISMDGVHYTDGVVSGWD